MEKKIVLLVLILGAVSLVLGCYMTFFESRGFIAAAAVIDHIEVEFPDTDEENTEGYRYNVYVRYKVGENDYTAPLGYFGEEYSVGQKFLILYNPDNPEQVHGDDDGYGLYLMLIGVLLMAGAGIWVLINRKSDGEEEEEEAPETAMDDPAV